MRIRILVIDDEEALDEILKFNLEREGYQVDTAYSAEEALEYDLSKYDLFIVDIMMGRLSGFDFAKRIKDMPAVEETPIIFCSALVGEDDKVMGLNIGGDDYITKPFVISEVLARVRAVLRRSRMVSEARWHGGASIGQSAVADDAILEPDLVYRGLRLDLNTKMCHIDDAVIELTRTEFDLLKFFLTHRGRVYTRTEIINNVWSGSVVSDRTIDANITRLRRKLGDYGRCIETRTGFGYAFKENLN